jgi:hypothetical protein
MKSILSELTPKLLLPSLASWLKSDLTVSTSRFRNVWSWVWMMSYDLLQSQTQTNIYAIGQQSTGKSSVIEALTGIKTPRDTGTCTRCPLMIDLEPSDDPQAAWQATVYLQQRYHWDPQANNEGNAKFPDWVEKATPDRIFFAQTHDPEELEFLIQRAQQATLSPTQDPQSFLDISSDGSNGTHACLFSPNIVAIQITKHDLPALSFYDLPGLISQAETEAEEYTVPLVRNLVSEYIASPDTLILVTCALEVYYKVCSSIRC